MRETLTDGVVTLHRYRPEDAADLFAAAIDSVDTVFPWLPWCHPGYKLEEAEGWIATQVKAWEERTSFEFVIRTPVGDHVGGGGISGVHKDHPVANLGYWVRTSQQGKGYATRAAKLLAEFGLKDVALERVEIYAGVGNHASLRVIEKLGAHREGILRNRIRVHGVMHDAVGHSLIPADLERNLADAPPTR